MTLEELRDEIARESSVQPQSEEQEAQAAPEVDPEAQPAEPEKKFRKTIKLDDGGERSFEADTAEELADRVTEALESLARKHAALKAAKKSEEALRPDNPVQVPASKQLSPDELFEISQQLASDPSAAVQKLIEAQFGMSIAEIKGQLVHAQNIELAMAQRAQAEAWVKSHPEYKVTQKNGARMMKLMAMKGLAPTFDNFEAVFNELKDDGLLDLATGDPGPTNQPSTGVPSAQPAGAVPAVTARPPALRTGLPVRSTAAPVAKRWDSPSELRKMSAKELRSRIMAESE